MDKKKSGSESPPTRKPFGWPFWLLLGGAIVILGGLTFPRVIRATTKSCQTEAINNLRQLGLALHKFEEQFGTYPNDSTAALLTKTHPGHGHDLAGSSSNVLLRQLFIAGIADNELMANAKIQNVRITDNETAPGELLRKGEVAFAYVAGLTPDGNPTRTIAFAPVIPGTTKFDPKPFGGKAVFLRIDTSVTSMNIRKDGHVIYEGTGILSPENPIWGGTAPDIRYPDL